MEITYKEYVRNWEQKEDTSYISLKDVKKIWKKDCIFIRMNKRSYALCFLRDNIYLYQVKLNNLTKSNGGKYDINK